MLASRFPGDETHNSKTGRKPLQPTNSLSAPTQKQNNKVVIKKETDNKENLHFQIIPIEPVMDASLTEELKTTRERKERLRAEREKTERVMRERLMIMERKMEEMKERGEVQRRLEIQVDRLFRLKEIKEHSKRNSTIQSLRDKEQRGKIKEGQSQVQGINCESTSECGSGSQFQSSSSEIHT